MNKREIRIAINRDMDIARAIVQAKKMSNQVAFAAVDQSKIATVVSELARNILKYAGHGHLILCALDHGTGRGIEIVAEDHGPGIDDTIRALTDHYSSAGTLGLGLPGVKRLMDDFELQSNPGVGTRVTVRKWL